MSRLKLNQLTPTFRHGSVLTRVSRMWDYRGGKDDGPIQHVDMVLIDEEGVAIYAEIAAAEVQTKKPLLAEQEIYVFKKFRVVNSKATYRPVDSRFMIYITCHTVIEPCPEPKPNVPRYVCSLTKFTDIPSLVGENRSFIDIIGMITEVGELETLKIQNQPTPTKRRILTVKDLRQQEMKIHIWGDRASEFDADVVCRASHDRPVVAIFVGLLAKSFRDEISLSGNAAARWYMDPDIPEIRMFLNSLDVDVQPVMRLPPTTSANVSREVTEPEFRTLSQIVETDPYKTCYIATDGKVEAELIFFDGVGRRLTGKDVKQVMRTCRGNDHIPADITAQIGQKYQLTLNISTKALYSPTYSYVVMKIDRAYGREGVFIQIGGEDQNVPLAPEQHIVSVGQSSLQQTEDPIINPGESMEDQEAELTKLIAAANEQRNFVTGLSSDPIELQEKEELVIDTSRSSEYQQLQGVFTPPPSESQSETPIALKKDISQDVQDGTKEKTARKRLFKDDESAEEQTDVSESVLQSGDETFNRSEYSSDPDKVRGDKVKKPASSKRTKKN